MSDQDSSSNDQKPQPVQTPTKTSSSSPPASNDALMCQWNSCGERLTSAEELYDHVCERHVGRKSTNNLSLTCQWGNCRTTTVKRDHITSHIRVHVPLKPHKCDFCGKAFKRPQDLKKHVKTHADDSVLMNSPEPTRSMHTSTNNSSYATSAGKLVADLQSLAASANGYYPDSHQMSTAPSYYANAAVNHSGYHGGAVPAHGSAYGPVYYAVPQAASNSNAEYELRKRAAFDALNEFFGDAKRRVIDPSTYYDVGQRLASLNTLPMLSGYSGAGVSDHYTSTAGVHTATQPLLQQQYSLPLPNLRTKTDLLNIDQFLDQLQSTVYENPNQAAAAGVAQAGTHYVPTSTSYRSSHSPPSMSASNSHSAVTPSAASTGNDTPALTPASSVLSYPSAHSPSSVHSAQTISPVSRSSIGSMYPTLPSVSTMSDFTGFTPTSGAPASGLASAFDADGRRRYSGGHLHKAKPASDGEKTPTTIHNTPTLKVEDTDAKLPEVGKLGIHSPAAKPAELAPDSPNSTDEADRANEAWVENIRIIEALRSFIKEKLDKGDFEAEKALSFSSPKARAADSASQQEVAEPMEGVEKSSTSSTKTDAENLYPVLKEL